MKVSAAVSFVIAVVASTSLALAQLEQPPTIELTDADRLVRACVRAEGAGIQCDEDTNMVAGPFVRSVFEQVSGNLGSSGNSQADQDTQLSSFSISGSLSVEATADLGGNQGAFIDAGADSNLGVTFSIPADSPYTLSGSFAASGVDGAFCLSGATVSMAGISADGSVFLHGRSFNCESPPEDADFFIAGTAQAGATLTLAVQLSAFPEGGGGLDLLGTGTASVNFSLDFGDRDGDGLLNVWEEEGIDIDNDGTPEIDLPGMGANPDKKDLFVEVDVMAGVAFDQQAINKVILAFAQAPASAVDNPDGSAGIQLHLIIDGDQPASQPLAGAPGNDLPVDYYTIKDTYFGSETDRIHPNWPDIWDARLKVFRYCLWADTFVSSGGLSISGIAEAIPSNDFVVAAGAVSSWFSDPNDRSNALAGTLMHELGHTIGLTHGGGSENVPNYKPNYLSVMNYAHQLPFIRITNQGTNATETWRLDYSRKAFSTVDENQLFETVSLGGPQGRKILFNTAPDGMPSKISIGWASAPEVDWDFSQTIETEPYQLDISNLRSGTTRYETLNSHTDWDQLWYPLWGDFNFDDRQPWPFAKPAPIGIDEDSYFEILSAEWVDQTAFGDLIFENGFELGSTTAWSETVP